MRNTVEEGLSKMIKMDFDIEISAKITVQVIGTLAKPVLRYSLKLLIGIKKK
jgi:hypothetical protein